MKCRKCGAEQGRGKFCQNCGQPVTAWRPQERAFAAEQAPSVKKSIILPVVMAVAVFAVLILVLFILFKVNMSRLGQNEGLAGVSASSSEGEPAVTPLDDSSSEESGETPLSLSAETPLDDSSAAETKGGKKESKKDKSKKDKDKNDSKDKEKDKTTDTSSSEADKPAEKTADYGWIDAYIAAAEEYEAYRESMKAPAGKPITYSLSYMNSDDIPEVSMVIPEIGMSRLYTYKDGKAKLISEMLSVNNQATMGRYNGRNTFVVRDRSGYNYWWYYAYRLEDNGDVTEIERFSRDGDAYSINGQPATEEQVNALMERWHESEDTTDDSVKAENLKAFKKLVHSYDPNYSEKETRTLSALELMSMSKNDLLSIIGDDYRASHTEFADRELDYYGITSDDYFPNVILVMLENQGSDQEALNSFSSMGGNMFFESVIVGYGGLIQDGASCGDTYDHLLTQVDSLNGVGKSYKGNYWISTALIGGFRSEISFNKTNELLIHCPSNIGCYDLHNTEYADYQSTQVKINRHDFVIDERLCRGVLTESSVPLRTAPYEGASILWYMDKNTEVGFAMGGVITGDGNWEWVVFTTDTGVKKCGYIRSEQMTH